MQFLNTPTCVCVCACMFGYMRLFCNRCTTMCTLYFMFNCTSDIRIMIYTVPQISVMNENNHFNQRYKCTYTYRCVCVCSNLLDESIVYYCVPITQNVHSYMKVSCRHFLFFIVQSNDTLHNMHLYMCVVQQFASSLDENQQYR